MARYGRKCLFWQRQRLACTSRRVIILRLFVKHPLYNDIMLTCVNTNYWLFSLKVDLQLRGHNMLQHDTIRPFHDKKLIDKRYRNE